MKILHVVGSMDPNSGGVSQAVRTMIKGLQLQAVTNEVLCLRLCEVDGNDKFPIHFTGVSRTAWNFTPGFTTWLAANMHHFEVVIVHGLWQYHTYAVCTVLNKLVKAPKLYVMPHGMLDPWFQHSKDRKLKAFRNRLLWQLIERNIIEKANGILFTSETEKKMARDTFSQYYPKLELVVGLGVEHPPEYSQQMKKEFEKQIQKRANAGYLLFLSRIDPKKGLSMLVEAYLDLKKEGHRLPDLLICGPGIQSTYGQTLRHAAAQDNGIFFQGMLKGDSKWGAFYGCEAFILPSHQENFGIAIVEALSCCKPVLITDQVNIYQQILESNAGLIESDSLDGVKKLLKRWISLTDSQKTEMTVHARNAYLSHYSVDYTTSRLKSALGCTLENPGGNDNLSATSLHSTS